MAKVGEGDPRWIVAAREDGKNVNNWHWAETDCLAWSKKALTGLLSDLEVLDDPAIGRCKTGTVQSVTGEATANIRKGKTIFYYELEVKVPWEGQLNGSDVIKGQFHLPYISEEHDDDKMEVRVTCDKSGSAQDKLTEILRKKGVPLVQQKVALFLSQLREEFSVKKTPNPQSPPPEQASTAHTSTSTSTAQGPVVAPKVEKEKRASSVYKSLSIKEDFTASPDSVYRMLTDPQMLNAITQGSAKFEPREGATFSLFGGNVEGENVLLVPPSKIVQKWRFSSWPTGHYSTVDIDITEKKGKTILNLTQKDVPAEDADRTEEGWRKNLFGRGKMMFGFGPAQIY